MIVSAISRDVAILQDIVSTLQQAKTGGQPNHPLVIPHTSSICTVSFYVDQAKSNLLFSDNSTDSPARFSQMAGRTLYVPDDSLLNFGPIVAQNSAQPLYWITVAFDDSTTLDLTYDNKQNLIFQSVKVSSEPNPAFSTNANEAILVPTTRKTDNSTASDDWAFEIISFDLRVQLVNYDMSNLSEQNRIESLWTTYNNLRLALMADRYRNGNSTLVNKDLDGTLVSPIKQLPSKDVLQGLMTVQCAYIINPANY